MLCTIAELCHLETSLVLRIRLYFCHLIQEVKAVVLGAEEGDKPGNPLSGSIPLVNFGLAAAVFRPFPLGSVEEHHTDKVLTVCWSSELCSDCTA